MYGFYICLASLTTFVIVGGSRACVLLIVSVFVAKSMKSFDSYTEELRQFNSASSIRRGKSARGYAPKTFADVFDYTQPRRNKFGAGDLKVTNTITGEVTMYKADEVSTAFAHIRSPKHSQYNLKYDKKDQVDAP